VRRDLTTDPVSLPKVGTFHRSVVSSRIVESFLGAKLPRLFPQRDREESEDRIEEVNEMNELKSAVEALLKHPIFRAGIESVIELVRRDMDEHTSAEADITIRIAVMLDYLVRVERVADLVEGAKIPAVREA
jgi:hypothetical protein